MFGYVRTYLPELKVRENEYYRAVYCGLCRSLGHCTGCSSRLTLNYDFVFAAIIRMAATGTVPTFDRRRCMAHPIKKRPMADPNGELDFCAVAGVLLVYGKTLDDITDERGSKRFFARTLRRSMKGMHKKAVKRFSAELDSIIYQGLERLAEIEKQDIASVDTPADCFGDMLGKLLSSDLDTPSNRIVAKAGYHLGRWLYIIDAADDFEEDIKKGRYNPFIKLYGEESFDETKKETIFNALTAELMEIEASLDLLEGEEKQKDIFAIIDNILHLGMPHAAHRVLYGEKGKDNERPL